MDNPEEKINQVKLLYFYAFSQNISQKVKEKAQTGWVKEHGSYIQKFKTLIDLGKKIGRIGEGLPKRNDKEIYNPSSLFFPFSPF